MYTNNVRDLKISKDKVNRLFKGSIISRATIAKSKIEDGKLIIENINYPIAHRIFANMHIEVLVDNAWKFVKSGDSESLKIAYGYKEEKPVIKEQKVEIDTTVPAPIENVVVDKPIIDPQVGQFSVEPKLLEGRANIKDSITTTSTSFESITIDSVNSSSTMEIEINATTKSEASEEVIVEEESEEDDDEEYEEVEEIAPSDGMNHSDPPRIVKKKKKHK